MTTETNVCHGLKGHCDNRAYRRWIVKPESLRTGHPVKAQIIWSCDDCWPAVLVRLGLGKMHGLESHREEMREAC